MRMIPADEVRPAPEPREASFVRLAEAYRKEGLLGDAVRICRDGLARFPASWPGRIVLGGILLEQGAVEEAYDELERVRRESRGRPEILAALEEVLKRAPTVASERVEPVGEPSSRDPLASPTLAKLYASQGDPATAEAILRQLGQGDRPAGARQESAADRARQRYVKSLTAFRSVLQRGRGTRPA
ncbi:MAG: tetratricopeptide repeat protein [candidate division NC10 bacterium]